MRVKKYYKLVRVDYEDSAYLRLKNVSNEAGIFSVTKTGTGTNTSSMEYSLDGVTWTAYDFSTLPQIAVSAGANIYFRGNQFSNTRDTYFTFSMDVDHSVGGNIMTLYNYTTIDQQSSVQLSTFKCLFMNDTHLVDAKDLNFGLATSIIGNNFNDNAGGAYAMFSGCTALSTAPDMTTLTTISYHGTRNMFSGCTALAIAPDIRNVTSVSKGSLVYFLENCTNLSIAYAPNISTWNTSTISTEWMKNAGSAVTGTKTLYCPTGLTIPTDSTSGIPTGWTRVDY